MPAIWNISHCVTRDSPFSSFGMSLPVFFARYSRIAPVSNTGKSPLPRSTIAGIRPLGQIFKNSGFFWSPAARLILWTLYGRPTSSRKTDTFQPFGVDAVYRSICGELIVDSPCDANRVEQLYPWHPSADASILERSVKKGPTAFYTSVSFLNRR